MRRAALGYVCAQREELTAELASLPVEPGRKAPSTLVDELLGALDGGGECGPWLDEVDAALRRSGDALGLFGRAGAEWGQRNLRLAGGSRSAPPPVDEVVYLCPVGRCSRHAFAGGDGVPRCALVGGPMREDRL